MLRRRLQQVACAINASSFSLALALLLAHLLLRRYEPHVAHGKENFDFFFEGDQEGDDRRHPLFQLDLRVAAGACLSALVSCAVDVGGVVWGGLHVGIYFLVVGFDLKAATGLSQAAIVGASLAALAANMLRVQPQPPAHDYKAARAAAGAAAAAAAAAAPACAHTRAHDQLTGQQTDEQQQQQQQQVSPSRSREQLHQQHSQHTQQQQQQQPLVDLDLVLLLTPGLLLGVALGVVLNDVLPEWFITVLLVLVLLLTMHKTAMRGLLMWHSELQAERSQAAAAAILSRPLPRLPPIAIGRGVGGSSGSSSGSSTAAGGARSGGAWPAAAGAAPAAEATAVALQAAAGGGGADGAAAARTGSAAAHQPTGDQQQQQQQCDSPTANTSSSQFGSRAKLADSSVHSSSASSLGMPQQPRKASLSSPVYFSEATPVSPLQSTAGTAASAAAAAAVQGAGTPPHVVAWFCPQQQEEQPPLAYGTGVLLQQQRQEQQQEQQQEQWPWLVRAWQNPQQALQQQQAAWLRTQQRIGRWRQLPWAKLATLLVLWAGFLGLSALNALLPLCSWAYVLHLLLFVGVTVCVTVTLIRVMLVQPLLGAHQVGSLAAKLAAAAAGSRGCRACQTQQQQLACGQRRAADTASATAAHRHAPSAGCARRALRRLHAGVAATAAACAAAWRGVPRWLHVLTGFGRPQQQQQHHQQEQGAADSVAACGGAAGDTDVEQGCQAMPGAPERQQQAPEHLSLFTRMRLQAQQQQQQEASKQRRTQQRRAGAGATAAHDALLQPLLAATAASDGFFYAHAGAVPGAAAAARVWTGNAGGSGALAAAAAAAAVLDAGAADEQPWRHEEPFPAQLAAASHAGAALGAAHHHAQPHASHVGERQSGAATAPAPAPAPAAAAAAVGAPATAGPSRATAAAAAATTANSNAALVAVAAAAAAVAVAAGIVSSLTGVAGSVLLLPILLDFRVHLQVATASTAALVFLSSSTAVLSLILQGRLVTPYALLFGLVSLCGGVTGVALGALLPPAALRRRSLVVLLLAAVLGTVGLACGGYGAVKTLQDWAAGDRLGLRAVCTL